MYIRSSLHNTIHHFVQFLRGFSYIAGIACKKSIFDSQKFQHELKDELINTVYIHFVAVLEFPNTGKAFGKFET